MSGAVKVAGAIPCRGGWIVVSMSVYSRMCRVFLCADFAEVCASSWEALAVEAPIGLPDVMERGGREADRAARVLLGRRSQVVNAPTRAVLRARSYAEACRLCKALTPGASMGLTRLSFGLFPRIQEIDHYIRPALQNRIYETHSELAFLEMRNRFLRSESRLRDRPLPSLRRTLPARLRHSRHRIEGIAERRELLPQYGFPAAFLDQMYFPPEAVREEDFLAACAACWAARRIFFHEEKVLPQRPPENRRGLRMEKRY